MAKKTKNIEVSPENLVADSELAAFETEDIFVPDSVAGEEQSFLPTEESVSADEITELADVASVDGTELDAYTSATIEDIEFIEAERLNSIIESILFASDRPVSLSSIKIVFKGTNVRTEHIRRAIEKLSVDYAGAERGVSLEEVPGGYQLRTKIDNMKFLSRTLKARPFRVSGPALEVLSIVAYKQPIIKSEIDEIRGVESGHLLRALMEKGLVHFAGKSDLPGKPMTYGTSKKFLEIFGLRNINELPTISQIDELLPEGITEEDEKKSTLSELTDKLSEQRVSGNFSQGEDELNKITDELSEISTSSEFFEKEKLLQKHKRELEKAQIIRDAIILGEEVSTRDRNWLDKFDLAESQGKTLAETTEAVDAALVVEAAPVEIEA